MVVRAINFEFKPKYFIERDMKTLIIFMTVFFLCNCNLRSNEGKKRNKCIQTYLANYIPPENLHYTPGGYEFRFSCSTTETFTPTCIDYYSLTSLDPNFLCPTSYTKFRLPCSRQNLVGVCQEIQDWNNQANGKILVSVFSKPVHSLDDAKIYCSQPEKKTHFFPTYRSPNDRSNLEQQQLDALLLCFSLIK